MREYAIWDDWVTYDKYGSRAGIRADAPDNVKNAYEEYVAEQEAIKQKYREAGKKIPK